MLAKVLLKNFYQLVNLFKSEVFISIEIFIDNSLGELNEVLSSLI